MNTIFIKNVERDEILPTNIEINNSSKLKLNKYEYNMISIRLKICH